MEVGLQLLVRILLYPIYVVAIWLPKIIESLFFKYHKKSIKKIQRNCVFLINPTSGNKLGQRVLEALDQLNLKDKCIDICQNDYVRFINEHLRQLQKAEKIYVVICGGDGTVSTIITEIEKSVLDMDQIVFVPMPIGTGNDLSQALNFGRSFGLSSFFEYFEKLGSPNTSIVKFDSWNVQFIAEGASEPLWKRKMLLYFNFGLDARVTEVFDNARQRWPFLFQLNVH